MFNTDNHIHYLTTTEGKLPKQFTYPFQYVPHKLCKVASEEVQHYLESQTDFNGNFDALGKMFGVLVVKTSEQKLAYLVAFSGKIDENVHINGFVPPVFDTLNPHGFYKKAERKVSELNKEIERFEKKENYLALQQKLTKKIKDFEEEIKTFKTVIKNEKRKRDKKRALADNQLPLAVEQQLKNESIRFNFLLKDKKKEGLAQIASIKQELSDFEKPLKALKLERKKRSADMQQKLHEHYRFLNGNKEQKDLLTIFKELQILPPAGTGECAAPKLLQFAYKNNLQPIAMAEFWWGKSPSSEIKKHKHFYPSCKSKCKPVLGFMLQGLNVAENPIKNRTNIFLDILYEDEHLLVLNKPHGFLSVPGNEINDSVFTRMQHYLPKATGALLVHRLDMSTSGLLVVAKTSEVHKNIQQQFTNRTVKKRYVAVLNGILQKNQGIINLPLRVDYHNRPRQLVCYDSGKPSITHYKVIERSKTTTKVYLYPQTGRTHQLRVHCAHQLGLNVPILGDDLYGTPKDRLYLHAEKLTFTHPITDKKLQFFCKADF